MAYAVKGRLLEACSCGGPCPCWVGDDPDGGMCEGMIAYHYDNGSIDGHDVSGLTLALVVHIPGNILQGNWKLIAFVDDKASPTQKKAILDAHTGKLGGPLEDLSKLVGEVLGVYDVPIEFNITEGAGSIRVGEKVSAEMKPYTDAGGRPTKLVDSIFSTIPGSPAFLGKAMDYRAEIPEHNMKWLMHGRNAVLGEFHLEA
jgi:hypothetical protein